MPLESMTQATPLENDLTPALSGARRLEWARKSFLTLCDQGFVSGTNFILGVVLAKRQGPAEYGTYYLAYAVFMLLANIHQAILLDPMSVLEAELFPENRPDYVRAVIKLHAVASALAVTLMALTLGVLFLTHNYLFTGSAAGVMVAFPSVLLYWVARSGVYLDFMPGRAAIAGCLYAVVCLTGLFLAARFGLLNPFSLFALMALGSVAAVSYLLRDRLYDIIFGASRGIARVWRAHWQYGRWSLGGVVVTWLQAYSLSVASGWLLGIRDTGILAALVNFILPVNHVGMASLRLFMPRLAGLRTRRGPRALSHVVRQLSLCFAGAASVYWVLIWLFHEPLIQRLYGGRFGSIGPLLPLATAYIIIWSAIFPFQMGLRALLAFDAEFLVLCVLAGIILPFGIPAMMFAGLKGVFAATFLAHAFALATVIILFQRRVHQRQTS